MAQPNVLDDILSSQAASQHLFQSGLDKRKYLFGGFPAPEKVLMPVFGEHVPDKGSTPDAGIARQPCRHSIDAVTVPEPVERTADQGECASNRQIQRMGLRSRQYAAPAD